jgi:hypothetical protein
MTRPNCDVVTLDAGIVFEIRLLSELLPSLLAKRAHHREAVRDAIAIMERAGSECGDVHTRTQITLLLDTYADLEIWINNVKSRIDGVRSYIDTISC